MVTLMPDIQEHHIERVRVILIRKLCGERDTVDPEIERTLDEVLMVAEDTVMPRGMFRILPVEKAHKNAIQTAVGEIQSPLFTRLVKRCVGQRLLVFMIATLGEKLERIGGSERSVFRQLVFEMVGSELVEIVADMVEACWRQEVIKMDLQYSLRFSPGYCDWALSGQSVIFACLDASRIGTYLTSHFTMVPHKSISAIAVAAEHVPFSTPCSMCGKEECNMRRLHA